MVVKLINVNKQTRVDKFPAHEPLRTHSPITKTQRTGLRCWLDFRVEEKEKCEVIPKF